MGAVLIACVSPVESCVRLSIRSSSSAISGLRYQCEQNVSARTSPGADRMVVAGCSSASPQCNLLSCVWIPFDPMVGEEILDRVLYHCLLCGAACGKCPCGLEPTFYRSNESRLTTFHGCTDLLACRRLASIALLGFIYRCNELLLRDVGYY